MNSDLQSHPHTSKGDLLWWYEEPHGITVILDRAVAPGGCEEIRISWRAIRGALARKDRKRKP